MLGRGTRCQTRLFEYSCQIKENIARMVNYLFYTLCVKLWNLTKLIKETRMINIKIKTNTSKNISEKVFAMYLRLLWNLCVGLAKSAIFIRPSSDGTYYGMVMSVRPSGSPSARFPHFSHSCFDILSWNFAHDYVLMYYRSSSSVVTLRQFLKELCLFVNLEYR